MTDYTSDDIKNICTFKTSLSPEIIDKVVQVAQLLNNAVNKEKLFGARGSPWVARGVRGGPWVVGGCQWGAPRRVLGDPIGIPGMM